MWTVLLQLRIMYCYLYQLLYFLMIDSSSSQFIWRVAVIWSLLPSQNENRILFVFRFCLARWVKWSFAISQNATKLRRYLQDAGGARGQYKYFVSNVVLVHLPKESLVFSISVRRVPEVQRAVRFLGRDSFCEQK